MSVCGSGGAVKAQVQQMVGALLGLPAAPESDHAADALAVAICHASHIRPAHSFAPVSREGGPPIELGGLAGEAL
jgi:crossover junction endodeoxyribonuclease RuvC